VDCAKSLVSNAMTYATTRNPPLPPPILKMEGMVDTNLRHFYHYLCSHIPSCRYLEVGAFKGASTCAALYENSATGVIIDNWSWDPSPRDDFYINVKQANIVPRLHIIEKGCWDVNVAQEVTPYGMFDVFLFDGPHSYRDQYKAMSYFYDSLSPISIVIVDDWNRQHVREGTEDAIKNQYKEQVVMKKVVNWWNGSCIMVWDKSIQKDD